MIKKILATCFGKAYYNAACTYRQIKTFLYSIVKPYQYNKERYKNTFLNNNSSIPERNLKNEPVEKIIYIFWLGDNEITPNRQKGIDSLKNNSEVKVQLVTPNNLSDYIVEEDPLPEGFDCLSLNHKSDYLRAYFMHHYGGGYADIKTYQHSWSEAFKQLENSDAYGLGYNEVGWWGAATQTITDPYLKEDLTKYWRILVGNGAFIFRKKTPFTEEWHEESKRRLIAASKDLKEHPARDFFGSNSDYPLQWGEMQGSIFHPLCLKFNSKLLRNNNLKPSFKDYR